MFTAMDTLDHGTLSWRIMSRLKSFDLPVFELPDDEDCLATQKANRICRQTLKALCVMVVVVSFF